MINITPRRLRLFNSDIYNVVTSSIFIYFISLYKTLVMEKKRDMKKHVTFVAALHIGFGILGIIGSLVVFFLLNFAQSFIQDVEIATAVLNLIKIIVPLLLFFTSILGIVGGIGLLSYQQWARIIIIVLSALNCLNVPIGTAKGVYSIWTLLQDESIELFTSKP